MIPFDFSTYGLAMREDLVAFETKIAALLAHKNAVDFAALHTAIRLFSTNADTLHASIDTLQKALSGSATAVDAGLHHLNAKLVNLERYLLTDAGLPHRPWCKNVIFGLDFYEGYSGTAFPGIDDAIAFRDNATTIQTRGRRRVGRHERRELLDLGLGK